MTAAWQTRLATGSDSVRHALGGPLSQTLQPLMRPEGQKKLRVGVVLLACLWIAHSLVDAVWSFVPAAAPLPPASSVLNPALPTAAAIASAPIDIDALVAAQLFGRADAAAIAAARDGQPEEVPLVATADPESLAGIEDGAAETRLPLVLKGIVAATDEGLGQAIIEHRNTQDSYRVGDELPVTGRVLLAKVMPTQVVLDNGGRYELLRLFDVTRIGESLPQGNVGQRASGAAAARGSERAQVQSDSVVAARLASSYRDRLYSDPRSLSELVTVSAVRDAGELVGYRVQPGRAAEDFRTLGFRPGDLVVAVNGLPLNPTNLIKLNKDMRAAQSAVFDIQRGEETLSLAVSLSGSTRP